MIACFLQQTSPASCLLMGCFPHVAKPHPSRSLDPYLTNSQYFRTAAPLSFWCRRTVWTWESVYQIDLFFCFFWIIQVFIFFLFYFLTSYVQICWVTTTFGIPFISESYMYTKCKSQAETFNAQIKSKVTSLSASEKEKNRAVRK